MPVDERYRRQVELLVRTLPDVAHERCFALKGGTAINLFVRNLPRLSVDIDLTYLPVADRARSLADIEAALRRIGERIEGALPVARVQTGVLREEGTVNKLFRFSPSGGPTCPQASTPGNCGTRDFDEGTGSIHRIFGLRVSEYLRRNSARKPVGITGGNVVLVKLSGRVQ